MANINTILVLCLSIVLKCDSYLNRCPTIRVENGRVRLVGRTARITCNSDFELVRGRNRMTCVKNQWDYNEFPVCKKISETYLTCDFESSDNRFCGWQNGILNDVDWLADRTRSLLFFNNRRHVVPGSSQYFTGNYISLDAGTYGSSVTGQLLSPPIQPVNDKQACLIFSYVVRSGNLHGTVASPILSVNFGGIPHWETSVGEGRVIIGLYKLDIPSTIMIKGKNCEAAIDNIEVTEDYSCSRQPYDEVYNSCQDNCGIKTKATIRCSCDWECFDNDNCCIDIEEKCPHIKPLEDIARLYLTTSTTTTTTTPSPPTTTTTTTTTITTTATITTSSAPFTTTTTTTTATPPPTTTTTTATPPPTTIITPPPTTTTTTTTATLPPTTTTTPPPTTTTTTTTTATPPPTTTTTITPSTSSIATILMKSITVKNNSTNSYTQSSSKVIHNFTTLNDSIRVTTQKNVSKEAIYTMPLTFITSLNITYTKFSPTTPMTIIKKPIATPAITSSTKLGIKVPLNSTTMSTISKSSMAISNSSSKLMNTLKMTTNSVTQNTTFTTKKLPLGINISSTTKLLNSSIIKINKTDKSNTPTIFEQPSTPLKTTSSNKHGVQNVYGINNEKPAVNNSTNIVLKVTYTSTIAPKTIFVNYNINTSLSSPTSIKSKHSKHKNTINSSTLPINYNNLPSIATENSNLKFNKTVEIPHEKIEPNHDLYNVKNKNEDNRLENPDNQRDDEAKKSNKLNNLVTISTYCIAIAAISITFIYTLYFMYSYYKKSSHTEIHSCFINAEKDSSCHMELISNSVE